MPPRATCHAETVWQEAHRRHHRESYGAIVKAPIRPSRCLGVPEPSTAALRCWFSTSRSFSGAHARRRRLRALGRPCSTALPDMDRSLPSGFGYAGVPAKRRMARHSRPRRGHEAQCIDLTQRATAAMARLICGAPKRRFAARWLPMEKGAAAYHPRYCLPYGHLPFPPPGASRGRSREAKREKRCKAINGVL